jgi:hypothetical protein
VAALADNDAFIEAACAQGADVDQVVAHPLRRVTFSFLPSHSSPSVGFPLVVAVAHCSCEWVP